MFFDDEDITALAPNEPLQDIWLQASNEFYSLVPEDVVDDRQFVCGQYRPTGHVRYCTRKPDHTGIHISGPDRRSDAVEWD